MLGDAPAADAEVPADRRYAGPGSAATAAPAAIAAREPHPLAGQGKGDIARAAGGLGDAVALGAEAGYLELAVTFVLMRVALLQFAGGAPTLTEI